MAPRGKSSARTVTRALALLKAAAGLVNRALAAALAISPRTVASGRTRFVTAGLTSALDERPRPGPRRKLAGRPEAHLVAIACSDPPAGHTSWPRQLLADQVVALAFAASSSRETVRQILKNERKPWKQQAWGIPQGSAECVARFVARMEDGLALDHEDHDPDRPVVCCDEPSKPLIEETRPPLGARPGRVERYAYEYKRNGTRNLFLFCEPQGGWRPVAVTARRTAGDFAHQLRGLVDEASPHAGVVRDTRKSHKLGSRYEAFAPAEARRVAKRLELPDPPKHGSWLNRAESEFSSFSRQCLRRRIGDAPTRNRPLAALERESATPPPPA